MNEHDRISIEELVDHPFINEIDRRLTIINASIYHHELS